MGILNLFSDDEKHLKKIETLKVQLTNSFTNIRKDIELQNKWINYLHQSHSHLKGHHDSHKEVTAKQLENIAAWIKHLNDNTKQHQERVETVEKHIQKAFKLYNDHIREIHKRLNQLVYHQSRQESVNVEKLKREAVNESLLNVENSLSTIKRQFTQELEQLDDLVKKQQQQVHEIIKKELTDMVALADKQKTFIKEEQKHLQPLPQQITQQYIPSYSYNLLTNPEKKLLSILFNEQEPLSYESISNKTGHSINTVRVNMNILKKKGFIEEHMLPSGVKLFVLNNKEKIKKMYNLEVI